MREGLSKMQRLGLARTRTAPGWDRWSRAGLLGCSACGAERIRLQVHCSGGRQKGEMKSLCGQISETDLGLGNRASMCSSGQENKHGLKPGVISFFREELTITCSCIEGHKVPITTICPHHCRAKTATGLDRAGF